MRTESKGVTQKLLESAKYEFMRYGFHDASLRRISKSSGVSTNSIYTRFNDKEGLLDALVKGAAEGLMKVYKESIKQVERIKSFDDMESESENGTDACLDFIYQNFDCFYIVFCRSEGTKYENYFDELAAIEEELYNRLAKMLNVSIDSFFIHVMCRSGWNYIYEAVSHKLPYEEAKEFMKKIKDYTMAGWGRIIEKYNQN